MNRAERRRRAKIKPRPPGSPQISTVSQVKAQLQQASSPEEVHQLIQALRNQGLPATAGEELQVYAAEFHDASALLQDIADPAVLAQVVENAHDWADTLIDQSADKDNRACRAGCALCCYLPTVLVTAVEVIHLAEWLRTHCSPAELSALRRRLTERLRRQTDPAAASSQQLPLPCALLQNDRCIAYAARPLKCRGWNSVRLEACEQAYGPKASTASQQTSHVPIDASAFVMGNAVLNGLSDSATTAGLDGTTHDLTVALVRALDLPDCAERWRKGEKIFTSVAT